MDRTKIEWTNATWSPIRGCSRVSPGCENCYAERHAARFAGEGKPWHGLVRTVNGHAVWTGRTKLIEGALDQPLRWKRPRKIFVCSMSDLFHESVPDEWLDEIFQVMAAAQRHTFQVLTKRAERMRSYLASRGFHALSADCWTMTGSIEESGEAAPAPTGRPLPNVWCGVSVENQAAADERIPLLLQTPAAARFLSCEPLLGPVDLRRACELRKWKDPDGIECCGLPRNLDWVIVGGESGPGARPMNPRWARSLRDQCSSANVPFFFKQWGEWIGGKFDRRKGKMICEEAGDGKAGRIFWTNPGQPKVHLFDEADHYWTNAVARVGKKNAGHLLDGVEHHAFPKGATGNV